MQIDKNIEKGGISISDNKNKLPNTNGFIEKRKKLKLWHRLLLMTGSIVVFITTYMLILPAITAEKSTIGIYNEVLSGSGIAEAVENDVVDDTVIEEITENITEEAAESPTEETTESSTEAVSEETEQSESDDDTDSEGGLSATTTLKDGASLTITAIESQEVKSLLATVANAVESIFTYSGSADDGSYVCEYDSETGDFVLDMHIDFTIPQSLLQTYTDGVVTDTNYTYYYTFNLPTGVTLTDDLVYNSDNSYSVYNGTVTGSNDTAFKYYFVPRTDDSGDIVTDAYGNICWTVVMVFSDSYLSTLDNDADIVGDMDIEINISSDYYQQDGSITITDSELNIEITIDANDITYTNETANEDLIVYKTATKNADGTVTYTVRVFTEKGTGDSITITDIITNTNSLSGLDADGLQSITYSTGTVGAVKYDYGLYTSGEDSLTYSDLTYVEDPDNTTTGNYYYYDSDGNIVIVLEGLDAVTDSTLYSDPYTTYNEYIIQYTYDVDPDIDSSYNVSNTAKAETEDEQANTTISDESTATITVRGTSIISKSGSYSNGEITWTITVGDGSTDLSGYVLSDTMFNLITSAGDIAITDSSGNTVDPSSYTINYEKDVNGADTDVIESITFNSGTKYTITYTTAVESSYSSTTYKNDADLTPSDGKTDYSAASSVTVKGGSSDSLAKKLDSAEADANNADLYNLTWTTDFKVPETGIPAGTTFIDYVSNGYITYSQAQAIITALQTAWGADNITDIQFCTDSGYSRWWVDLTSDSWINAEDLATDGIYYSFKFTLVNEKAYDNTAGAENTVSVTYTTTADISSVEEYKTFYNTVYIYGSSDVYVDATYTYNKNVVKYGINSYGSPNSTDVNISTSESGDTEVTWIVRVLLSDYNDYTDYTVTDNLPPGVTLSSVAVSRYDSSDYTELTAGVTSDVLYSALSFNYTTSDWTNGTDTGTSVVLNITDTSNTGTVRDTDAVYIKYTCIVNMSSEGTYSYQNNVEVTANGSSYGSDDETIYVTYTEEVSEKEEVLKDSYFDVNNNVIEYTLSLNPDQITYTTGYPTQDDEGNYIGEEYADLTVKDVLTYYTYPSYGVARDVELMMSTVHLYYAATDSNGNLIYDNDGNLTASSKEVDSGDWSWTYTSEQADYSSLVTNTITLTIPNGTALVFEYQYYVKITIDENASWKEYNAGAKNTAEISTANYTISTTDELYTNNQIEDSATSARANGGAGYTIYKVNADNFSIPISDTYFDLYVYDSSSGTFELVDTFITNSNGQAGISGTYTVVEENSVRQYDSTDTSVDYLPAGIYYKITLSDGSTSYYVPSNTMCYFVESKAAEFYKLDTTKYYFYFGSTVATTTGSVTGYDSSMGTVHNIISSHTQYISNKHSSDYYASKTSLSVIKTWIDSEGNEYTKTDGSITFKLFRIYTDAATGEQSFSPDNTSGTGGQTNPGSSSTIDITLKATTDSSYSYFWDSSTTTVDASSSADVVLTFNYNTSSWTPTIEIKNLDTDEILDTGSNGTWVYGNTSTYTYTISDVGTSNLNLALYCNDGNTSGYSVYINGTYTETTTESTTEASTESTTEASTESTTEATTVYYYHNFSDDDYYYHDGDTEDFTIGYYRDDNYFTISGNLSDSHGTCLYDVDGDGNVDSDEVLKVCLKMENHITTDGPATTITFTNAAAGTLELVFNSSGADGETGVTNSVNIDGTVYPAVNNIITVELEAGDHTITRSSKCYLFYISFTEGLVSSSDSADGYLHSFNNSTKSSFYTISGSTGVTGTSNYGAVTYNNEVINQFLKLNSKASITFDAPEDGILYLVMTNAISTYANKTVGVLIDGVEHHATATGEYDSEGNPVYLLTARITEGSHTITRINSTEFQLYYIGYVPDDYADAVVTSTTPYNQYGELVDTYTISYSDAWSWSKVDLPLEYVDDDGNVLGYYSYYVVEVDDAGNYITQYKNVSSDGISAGTMGIINQVNGESSAATSMTVSKKWLSSDGNELAANDENVLDSITFNLYSRLNIYSQYAESYDGGTSYSRYFTKSATLDNDSDGFFTVSGSVQASSSVGEVTFTPPNATTALHQDII